MIVQNLQSGIRDAIAIHTEILAVEPGACPCMIYEMWKNGCLLTAERYRRPGFWHEAKLLHSRLTGAANYTRSNSWQQRYK